MQALLLELVLYGLQRRLPRGAGWDASTVLHFVRVNFRKQVQVVIYTLGQNRSGGWEIAAAVRILDHAKVLLKWQIEKAIKEHNGNVWFARFDELSHLIVLVGLHGRYN